MRQGFSLVELSIVLVILGLLIGGVLTGQNLIKAAELRSISKEVESYATAANIFREKYLGLPGDITNATSFWGDNNTYCADAAIANGTPGTCNGNNNGQIANAAAASSTGETFQFWNQLALAGLLEGTFTGISGSGGVYHSTLGTNIPRSRYTSAGWSAIWIGAFAGDTQAFAYDYGNAYEFGALTVNSRTVAPVLRPEEAWNLDTKMDDGKPAQGKIIARFWNNTCSAADDGGSANNDLVASYRLTDSTAQCGLYFVKAL